MSLVEVVVPALPTQPPADVYRSWRRQLTDPRDIEADAEVTPGARVRIAVGALLLVVDETRTGWGEHYRTGKPYPIMSAQVSWLLVTEDGGLKQVGTNSFKAAKSLHGDGVANKSAKLLERYPVPEGELSVLEEGTRRPNLKPSPCRWCRKLVAAKTGFLVGHGPQAQAEHVTCPDRPAVAGTPCELCSVPVVAGQATQVMVREGEGRWSTVHVRMFGQPACTNVPVASPQEQAEAARLERAAQAEEREREREAAEKKETAKQAAALRRRAAREVKERELRLEAERTRERVAAGTVTATVRTEEASKGLGWGRRAYRHRVDATLADGSTASWWTVTVTGGTGEDDDRPDPGPIYLQSDAVSAYQALTFDADPRTAGVPRPVAPPTQATSTALPRHLGPGMWRVRQVVGADSRTQAQADGYRVGAVQRLVVTEHLDDPALASVPGRTTARRYGQPAISGIFTVVAAEAGRAYDADDGDGSGTGYPWEVHHSAQVRPATDAEAAPVLAQEAHDRRERELLRRYSALFDLRAADAEYLPGRELAERIGEAQVEEVPLRHDSYGHQYEALWSAEGWPWALAGRDNSQSGDNWDLTNFRHHRVHLFPLTPPRADLLRALRDHFAAPAGNGASVVDD